MSLALVAACSPAPAPVAPQHAQRDPCVTTTMDIYRLADDSNRRRYLAQVYESGRPLVDGGTFRLDTSDAHVVAPFDAHAVAPFYGLSTIVRAPLDRNVLALSIVSLHAYGRDIACPLRTQLFYDTRALYPRDVASYTRTFDALPVADPPLRCAHPFVDGGAYWSRTVKTPAMARQQGTGSTVVVSVIVDENGKPQHTRIAAASSSSAALEHAALAAAKARRYRRPIYRCARSPQGQGLFRADFTPRG